MRILILILALSACQTAPSPTGALPAAEILSTSGLHSYSLSCSGTGTLALALLGTSEPSGTYQVYLPSGGGVANVSSATVVLALTDASANAQATVTSGTLSCTLSIDAAPTSAPIVINGPASYDWGYL